MIRTRLTLSAVLACAGATPAQNDQSEAIGRGVETQLLPEITSRLGSDNLATVAWGAHIAATHRVKAAVPALRETLDRLRREPGLDPEKLRYAGLALFDALIQTRAKVSAEGLEAFGKGVALPAMFVLLANDVRRNRDFFAAHYVRYDQQGRFSYWVAAGNLLAAGRDSELAGLILPTLNYTLSIMVRDPGDPVGAGLSGGAGGGFGDGKLDVPDGFPPTALYTLTTRGQVGDTLMAPGDVPVYARRRIRRGTKIGFGSNESIRQNERQRIRLAWLTELLDTYSGSLGDFRPSLDIEWQSREHYLDTVANKQVAVRRSFAKLVARCAKRDLIDADTAEDLEARIEPQIFDLRKKNTEPLPPIK